MKVYTIFGDSHQAAEIREPENIIAVRDGFSWLAFLFAPFWFLWRSMWLHALLAVGSYMFVALLPIGGFSILISFAIALFIGFEARYFHFEFLQRQGLSVLGNIGAPNSDIAYDLFLAEREKTPMKAAHDVLQDIAEPKSVPERADMFFGRS